MIEKLKDKSQAQPYGLLSLQLRKELQRATKTNCLVYSTGGDWQVSSVAAIFAQDNTYIIKPDYEDKPEYVDIEIVVSHKRLLAIGNSGLLDGPTSIHKLVTRPDFVQFFYHITDGKVILPLDKVATACRMSENGGPKVYVRFVKD